MTARRHLTGEEMLAAAETLHLALLEGIARARRWGKAELAFQGGTALHLVYGSPRASEDLDFIVASDKGLAAVMEAALSHARSYVRQSVGPEAQLALKARDAEGARDARNPRVFTISFKAPAFLEAVKVRVEFYVAGAKAARRYESDVRAARLSTEAAMRRPVTLAVSQAIVPTALMHEVFADKIYAVGAREYLKYRDVFDLWWLDQQGAALEGDELLRALEVRRALYPDGPAIDPGLAARLRSRAREIVAPRRVAALSADMSRWLALSGGAMLASVESAHSVARVAAEHLLAAADAIAPSR
jgi:hypothetical protein